MSPNIIFYIGLVMCCISLVGAITGAVVLRFSKIKLNKYLYAQYGKRGINYE